MVKKTKKIKKRKRVKRANKKSKKSRKLLKRRKISQRKVKKPVKVKVKTKRKIRRKPTRKNPPLPRKRRLPPSPRKARLQRKSRRAKPEIAQAVHRARYYQDKKKRQTEQISNGVHRPKIKVIGIGGGGGSIINEIAPAMKKIDFVAANTDIQALKKLSPKTKQFSFGRNMTQGLGTGMNPKLGELAAQSEKDRIKRLMGGQDLCIFVSCLGGGTGSGATPFFAEIAKESDVLTFGIFTMPFKFEGGRKMKVAKRALKTLENDLNAVCIIPNQRIFQIIDQKTPLRKALSALNKILAEDLKGLIEFIYWPGLINIDFADLKSILEGRGKRAYLNSAKSQGKNRAEDVVEKVLNSPLYQYGISGTERILFNIEGGKDLKMSEVEQVSKKIYSFNPRAKIIFGVAQYPKYRNKMKIALLAVSPGKKKEKKGKKKVIPASEPKKELIEEKLDLPLEKIEKIKAKRPKKSKKAKPKKIKKRTRTPKKTKTKRKPSVSQKKLKTKAKRKAISPLSARKLQRAKKSAKKPRKPIKKAAQRKKKKKLAVKIVKKEQQIKPTVKPKEIITVPSPYNEVLNSQTKIEKIRKSALDLKKEAEEVEKDIEKKERKWDIPAFLRRKKPSP